MSALGAIGSVLAGVALVVWGAERLVDGLLATAARIGVSAFALTALLSGFEAENLAAGVAANLQGLAGAAAGTFLGGTTFLAIGVAGIAALAAPIRVELPLRTLLYVAATPLLLLLLGSDGRLSRIDGLLLLAWFAVAIAGVARGGERRHDPADAPRRGRVPAVLLLTSGLVVLTVGGALLGRGIRSAAQAFGVSATLLGNTVVAASVELEEVARVAVPSRRGRGDLAVANLLGTVVHFAAFNAGLIALVRPLPLDTSSRALHLPACVVATLLLCLVLKLRGGIGRWEGAILLAAYVVYLALAVAFGS